MLVVIYTAIIQCCLYVAELKEAFIIYDSDQDGKVNVDQATQIIRSIGISPTMDELADMLGGTLLLVFV